VISAFFVCLLVFASLGPLAQPPQSAAPQPHRSDCCAKMMRSNDTDNDCGKQMPNSKQDQQCCAICVIALDLFLASGIELAPPMMGEETFARYLLTEHSRSDPPPIPPPRLATV
jgi:hypothetical protein